MIRALYEAYKQDVYRYLLHLCGNVDLAEDLTSDTFLAALLALPRFRGDAELKTWLFAIARNKWRESLRRRRETLPLDEVEELPGPGGTAEEQTLARERSARLGELMAAEPERTQRLMTLRTAGHSYGEIARALGISESSARVIEFRLRRKWKGILEKEGWGNDGLEL